MHTGFPVGMVGNGMISSQPPMGCQVSRGRAKAHMKNNLAGGVLLSSPSPWWLCAALVAFTAPKLAQGLNSHFFSSRGRKRGEWGVLVWGVCSLRGWWWFSSGEASRKGECAWLRSSTRAAGREDADYNNKQMLGIDYHTAVRAGGTKGGDPQWSFGGCSRILCWAFFGVFLLTQRKLLFRRLLMGLGFSVAQHLLGKVKRAGGAWLLPALLPLLQHQPMVLTLRKAEERWPPVWSHHRVS